MDNIMFAIPPAQWLMAVMLALTCLVFGRYRLGLLVAYFFCLHWGYVSNMPALVQYMGGSTLGLAGFFVLGMALALLGLVLFLQPRH